MKKLFVFILILAISTILLAEEAKKYGEEITLKEKTNISTILGDLEKYEGKKVLVEGTVIGVCEKRGCWIELAGEESEKIRVKVEDGVIVFPMEAKGKKALVEGEVFSVVIKGEGCGGDCKDEHKEDKHKEESKENCASKQKTKKVYMIKGLGAVIS